MSMMATQEQAERTRSGARQPDQDAPQPPTLPSVILHLGSSFSLLASYTGQDSANPFGGLRQGSACGGQIFFGIDDDLRPLACIKGGSLRIAATNHHGRRPVG
ncbi:hypothetical protein FF100_25810 [Methylobacterium terricola]|uniref:Uncharacterized protein n=2 Tax=Methylobacterium terricola TaxID=2583531 RepID=A0A5C4LAA0_9HYPH|nr:hypothetical protein FF100_25810 [Methylobacterium terricola]